MHIPILRMLRRACSTANRGNSYLMSSFQWNSQLFKAAWCSVPKADQRRGVTQFRLTLLSRNHTVAAFRLPIFFRFCQNHSSRRIPNNEDFA